MQTTLLSRTAPVSGSSSLRTTTPTSTPSSRRPAVAVLSPRMASTTKRSSGSSSPKIRGACGTSRRTRFVVLSRGESPAEKRDRKKPPYHSTRLCGLERRFHTDFLVSCDISDRRLIMSSSHRRAFLFALSWCFCLICGYVWVFCVAKGIEVV